jgi:hypothetical protein
MTKRTSAKVISSCLLATAMVLPPAAAAASQGQEDQDAGTSDGQTPLPVVEGLTPAEVAEAQQYLLDNGLPVEQIESFAALLEMSVPDLYRSVTTEIAETGGGVVKTPVEIVDDGKIRYNNTAIGGLPDRGKRTETQQGHRAEDGSCSFPMIAADTTLGQHVLSEVTELDPETCARSITSTAYDPNKWDDLSPQARIPQDSFIPGLSCKDGGWPDTDPPTLFQPNALAPGEHRRYYKQAFVDPICISITSTALNVTWKNQFNSGNGVGLLDRDRRTYYYEQLGENWVDKSTTLSPESGTNRPNELYVTLEHHRTETDFPDHVVDAAALLGGGIPGIGVIGSLAAVWVACGFDFGDTHFGSWQQFELRRNGGWSALGSAYVTGGCSNLVHEQVWHGAGSYAR